jgi:hypothetical protein
VGHHHGCGCVMSWERLDLELVGIDLLLSW